MDWDDLRHFLALARQRSVRGAASELGVSHSTVARRVEALEARLGTRLFDRHRDGVVLTEAGERMLVAAERVEDEVCALTRDAAGHDRQLAGPLHLTCGDEYVAAQLLADPRPWCGQHPEVELSVTVDGRPFNLAKGEADVAVRALPSDAQPPDAVIARPLAPIHVANYVARAHADRLDPTDPATRWLAFDDRRFVERLVRAGSYPDLPLWGSFSTLRLMVHAVRAGLGVSLLPSYVGDADPELVRLPRADLRLAGRLWLLYHPDLRDNARVRAARTVITEGFERRAGLYEGWSDPAPRRPVSGP